MTMYQHVYVFVLATLNQRLSSHVATVQWISTPLQVNPATIVELEVGKLE